MLTYDGSKGWRRPLHGPPHPQAALSHFLSASLFVCSRSQGQAVPVCVPADVCNARRGRFCLESFLGYGRDAFFPCHYSLRAERPKTLRREQQKALREWRANVPEGLHPVFKASLSSSYAHLTFLFHAVGNTMVMYVCDPRTLQLNVLTVFF